MASLGPKPKLGPSLHIRKVLSTEGAECEPPGTAPAGRAPGRATRTVVSGPGLRREQRGRRGGPWVLLVWFLDWGAGGGYSDALHL